MTDDPDFVPNRAERRRQERAASKAGIGCHSSSPQQTQVFEDVYHALLVRDHDVALARYFRGCERRARPRERRGHRRVTRSTGNSGDDDGPPGPRPAALARGRRP